MWSSDIKMERQQGWSRGDAHGLVCHHPFATGPWGAVSFPGKELGGAGGSALPVGPRWERSQGCGDAGHLALDKARKSSADLLSPPIAIFQRKGKILRESHKKTLSLRLTDRLNLRVSAVSSGTLLQLWQSCSLQRRATTAWDFTYPERHFKPNCCINCCARGLCSTALLAKRQPAPHISLDVSQVRANHSPSEALRPTATSRQKQSSKQYPVSSN